MTTLLAVDDSKTMRKVLEITFAGEDFETRIAGDAQDAFSQLADHPIGVALVDITLGQDSGYDVCRRVKAEYPSVRVLLLSSKQSPYDPAKGATSGADDHLDKPFDTQVLLDKVRALALRRPSQPAIAATTSPQASPTAVVSAPDDSGPESLPVLEIEASDSRIPTAMPEGPDEDLLEDEGPILIPIEEEPEVPVAAQPVAPAPLPVSRATTRLGEVARAEKTMPAAAFSANQRPGKQNGSTALKGLEARLTEIGLTADQISGVLALSKEVVEAAVWEVVPSLAETLIKEEIRRLTE